MGFPCGMMVKNPPGSVGDTRVAGSIPGFGRSPGEGNGNPFQYPCLENPMNRGTWWATVHGAAVGHNLATNTKTAATATAYKLGKQKHLLYSTGNCIQYPVITCNGR